MLSGTPAWLAYAGHLRVHRPLGQGGMAQCGKPRIPAGDALHSSSSPIDFLAGFIQGRIRRRTPLGFDVITVGGGLAGSTLATELARAGHNVLVLERETHFKDRVRGENTLPWGVAAARRLELVDSLLTRGGPSASVLGHLYGRQPGCPA